MPGAVNIAELAVRITADGVEPATQRLRDVENAGKKASEGLKGTSETAQSLYFAFNGLAGKAFGVNQSLSDLFARISSVAVGTTWTAGILVGLTVIGEAWHALSGEISGAGAEAKKAADDMKKAIADMVNAGSFTQLELQYRDAQFGSRASGYSDGIDGPRGLRSRRAALYNERLAALEQQKRELAVGAGGLGTGAGGVVTGGGTRAATLQKEIDEIDAQIAKRQDEINQLYGALTDPNNSLRAADRTTTTITTKGKSTSALAADAKRAEEELQRAHKVLVERQQNPGLADTPDMEPVFGLNVKAQAGVAQLDAALKEHSPAEAMARAMKQLPDQPAWAKALVEAQDRFKEQIGDALGNGIAAGITAAISSGSIGAGFKALGSTMVGGLGQAMTQFGIASLKSAIVLDGLLKSFMHLLPGGAVLQSLELIAIGAALTAAAGHMFGGAGGGSFSGGSYGSYGGSGGGASIIDRGYIGTSGNVTADGMRAIRGLPGTAGATSALPAGGGFVVMQPVIIGPNDPTAQRGIVDLLNAARDRGVRLRGT
jgi:hypothetical protein